MYVGCQIDVTLRARWPQSSDGNVRLLRGRGSRLTVVPRKTKSRAPPLVFPFAKRVGSAECFKIGRDRVKEFNRDGTKIYIENEKKKKKKEVLYHDTGG